MRSMLSRTCAVPLICALLGCSGSSDDRGSGNAPPVDVTTGTETTAGAETPEMTAGEGTTAEDAAGGEADGQPEGTTAAERAKITREQAEQIALQEVPGEVTDIAIEKKMGKDAYVVEIIATDDAAETDVMIDIMTGEILGTEK